MVTMRKGEFKLYMCAVVDSLEGAAYDRFAQLFLTACGVVDEHGNLTADYANSPYWAGGTGGEPLRPVLAGVSAKDLVRLANETGDADDA